MVGEEWMEIKEVLKNLCIYDFRNPDHDCVYFPEDEDEIQPPRVDCYCDNCFYGRDKLAMEILKLREEVSTKIEGDENGEATS